MKVKTELKAGLLAANHNSALRVRSCLRAGGAKPQSQRVAAVSGRRSTPARSHRTIVTLQVKSELKAGGHNLNHNDALRVRTTLKAGGEHLNHNEFLRS